MTTTGTAHQGTTTDEASGGSRRAIESEDLFRFRFVTAADLSPDGGSVAFALTRTEAEADLTDVFLLDVATGEQRQLTHADALDTQPAFSPDGSEIAYLSTQAGIPQIFAVSVEGGEPRQVTTLPRGVGSGPVWSPDGARIAFTAGPQGAPRDPAMPYRVDRTVWRLDGVGLIEDAVQDIYLAGRDGGEPARLTEESSLLTSPQWTPDGAALIYVSGFGPDAMGMRNRLRRVDLDGVVTDVAGGGTVAGHTVCPDGRVVYALTYPDGQLSGTKGELWVYDPANGAHECRTTGMAADVGGKLQPDMPAFLLSTGAVLTAPASDAAYIAAQRGGEVGVYRVALSGPEHCERVLGGPRGCAPVRLRGSRLLFAAFGVCDPGQLHLYDTGSATETQLTRLNQELLDTLAWPAVHPLEFTSGDGTGVEGWYLAPTTGQRPYPTVLGIHGGPHSGWGHTFNFDFLMLAGAGYGVLSLNHRGSTGYGDAFATAIHADWGNLDYQDLMAGVDHAIDTNLAEPDRLGVFGMSGGGTLSGWIVGHTDRFRAACVEDPLLNFTSIYGSGDIGIWLGRTLLGGDPHERPEVYRRCSPVTYAHRCSTPTLFLQQESDYRSPPEQVEQFYAILKAQGVTTEMVRFPGTPHTGSILGPVTHRRAQNDALLEWMNRHLTR